MAAIGKTPILLYGSTTATNTPSAGNLTNSSDGCEIAINVADKNLFFKDSTNAVNTVPIRQSSASSNGWLSSTDWSTFNSKQPAGTYVTSVTGTAPVVSSGGTTPAISMAAATGSVNGYLTSTDWSTFNGKQAALVSGTNIKTVNGTTLLGSGDLGTIGVGYGGTGTATAFTAGSIVFAGASGVYSQNNASLFWDNSNGRLGVGTATPGYTFEAVTNGTFGAIIRSNDATAANNAGVLFRNTASATTATRTSYIYLDPNGANGSGGDYFYISATGDGTATIGNQISGTVNFINAGATKMSIGANDVTVSVGNLVIGTSGKGIDFSATAGTGTSELLADYEEGTWTPTLTGGTTNPTVTYGANTLGRYTKVGNLVSIKCRIDVSTYSGGSGTLQIAGIPYAPKASSGQYPMTTFTSGVSWGVGKTQIMAWAQQGLSVMFMWGTQNNGASYDVVVGDVAAGDIIMVNGTYLTD